MNDSRSSWHLFERIQFLHPDSSTGRVHVSIIDLVDSGFESPWKAPILPWRKRECLAFPMFSETDFEASRSSLHQYPKHLPSDLTGMTAPFTSQWGYWPNVLEWEKGTISNLLMLSWKKSSLANMFTIVTDLPQTQGMSQQCECHLHVGSHLHRSGWSTGPFLSFGVLEVEGP